MTAKQKRKETDMLQKVMTENEDKIIGAKLSKIRSQQNMTETVKNF